MSSKKNQVIQRKSLDDKTSIKESLAKLQSMLLESEIRLRELLVEESKSDLNPVQVAELSGLKRTVESIRRVKEIFEAKL
jgi:hypothetical protein